MNILNFLKIGIMIFLSFENPSYYYMADTLFIKCPMKNFLTEEMKKLIINGVDLEFNYYLSIKNQSKIKIIIIQKKIFYNYEKNLFTIEEYIDNNSFPEKILSFPKIEDVDNYLKFNEFSIKIEKNQIEKENPFHFFCEIGIEKNKYIEEKFKIKTMDLWDNYKPKISFEIRL